MAFNLWCEIFIKFCQTIADVLQHPGASQSRYVKPKFRESLSLDDIAKSHLEQGGWDAWSMALLLTYKLETLF